MMRTVLAILLWGAALSVSAARLRPPVAGVVISYSVPPRPLTLHQPVILKFSLKNDTDQTISVDLGQDRKGSYEFSVTPPNGTPLKLPQRRHGGISALGDLSLQPGETFSQELVLNEWCEFPVTGAYQLQGELTEPILVNNGASEERDSGFHAVIEIAPRDEVSLAADCDSLASRIEASETYEEAAQAALALRYVKDPIAVPYLRRALFARKLVEVIAVQGLESIGDDEAVHVLASVLNVDLPGDTAILARAALQRIEQQTPDPARKQAIKEMLQQNTNH